MALRPAAIYGEGEQRHLPRIIRHMDGGLFVAKIGNAVVDWVHIENLTEATALAIKKLLSPDLNYQKAPCANAYFISDGQPIDNFEFLRPLCEARMCSFPLWTVPYWILLPIAAVLENIYRTAIILELKLEPFLTQAEIFKVLINNLQ